jgi:hypothetical protein
MKTTKHYCIVALLLGACVTGAQADETADAPKIYVPYKDVAAIVIKSKYEAAVHLDSIIVEQSHALSIVFCSRALLACVGDVLVLQRFESNKDARATCQRHFTNQRWIVGHVNRHGCGPDFVKRPQCSAELP